MNQKGGFFPIKVVLMSSDRVARSFWDYGDGPHADSALRPGCGAFGSVAWPLPPSNAVFRIPSGKANAAEWNEELWRNSNEFRAWRCEPKTSLRRRKIL